MANDDPLWVERYRPETLDDCVLPVDVKNALTKFVEDGMIPNLLLVGGPGVGKTSVALALVRQLNSDSLVINASMSGNIDTLRNEVTQFASTVSLSGGRKYVVLDEADYLNPNSTQPSLRNFIESFSGSCGFILTCNYPTRIIEPLRSRLSEIRFDATPEERPRLMMAFNARAKTILEREGVEYDKEALATLVVSTYPDWRKVINRLQFYSRRGKIDSGIMERGATDVTDLLDRMRKKSFGDVLEWVSDRTAELDYQALFSDMYEHAKRNVNKVDLPTFIVLLAKYQHMSAHVADQEINLMAMLTEMMAECQFE
jgi:DNA polymerase III delta prime subunit